MKQKLYSNDHVELWDRAWPQSQSEFDDLIEAFADRLLEAAFRRLGNIHDAEDILQDVIIKAYQYKAKDPMIRIGPYLYKMTINACYDLKRKKHTKEISVADISVISIAADKNDPSKIAAAKDEMLRINLLLSRLPKAQAEVIRLRVFDCLKLSEIAEITGSSIDTVNSRLRYGYKKLRKMVAKGKIS